MKEISYFEHESTMARLERTIRRLWILTMVLFAVFVITNAAWIACRL